MAVARGAGLIAAASAQMDPKEIQHLLKGFTDEAHLATNGVIIGGAKFQFLRLEKNKEIQAKKVRVHRCEKAPEQTLTRVAPRAGRHGHVCLQGQPFRHGRLL